MLNLELWPRHPVISWAREVIAAHPNHNVIIVTHSYLNGGGGIEQETVDTATRARSTCTTTSSPLTAT